MTGFELIAVAVTLLAVWMTAREIIWCWPTALLSVSLYAVVFFQAKLYAEVGLQGVYFLLSAYGWWAWLHGGHGRSELSVATASRRALIVSLVLGSILALVLGTLLHRHTDASLPFMDSALTAFSLIAQWMMTRKLLECWLLWIAVDVFYVGMFIYKGLYPTAGLYAVFLLLAGMGFSEWKRSIATTAASTLTDRRTTAL